MTINLQKKILNKYEQISGFSYVYFKRFTCQRSISSRFGEYWMKILKNNPNILLKSFLFEIINSFNKSSVGRNSLQFWRHSRQGSIICFIIVKLRAHQMYFNVNLSATIWQNLYILIKGYNRNISSWCDTCSILRSRFPE